MMAGFTLFAGCSGAESPAQMLRHKNRHQLDSIRKAVLDSYRDTIKIDTSAITDKGDTVTVKFRHYCSFDKKINVPGEYLDVYNLPKFQTHNFVSEIEIKINSTIVSKGLITKDDFKSFLSDDLKKYGVLKPAADISISGKTIYIEYGIGIPLSDFEWGYMMQIDSLGKKKAGGMD